MTSDEHRRFFFVGTGDERRPFSTVLHQSWQGFQSARQIQIFDDDIPWVAVSISRIESTPDDRRPAGDRGGRGPGPTTSPVLQAIKMSGDG